MVPISFQGNLSAESEVFVERTAEQNLSDHGFAGGEGLGARYE